MSEMGRIGVVIPAYNAAEWVVRTLDSVLATGTKLDLEVIVVDDGSKDDTAGVVEQYAARDARVRLLRQANTGPAGARNNGLRSLSADVRAITFLDADDEIEPGATQLLAAALAADPKAIGAYGVPRYVGRESELIREGQAEAWTYDRYRVGPEGLARCPVDDPTTFEMLVLGNCICTPGQVLVRREIADRLGGFDPELRGPEDWDFWLRATVLGHLRLVDEFVLKYRQHGSQISSNFKRMRHFKQAMVKKLLRELPPDRREVLAEGQRWSHWLLSGYWYLWALESLEAGRLVEAANNARHAAQERLEFSVLSRKRSFERIKRALL